MNNGKRRKVSRYRRLAICYAAPGHSLLSSSGPTRNVLSLAEALSHWADVTVAFRSLRESITSEKYKVIAIEPSQKGPANDRDDEATRGLNPFAHLSYCRALWSFSRRQADSYDLVLEKGWRLSGSLLNFFRLQGVPGVLVENDARCWSDPINSFRMIFKYVLHHAAQFIANSCSRRVPLVIAETEELKNALIRQRGIPADRVEVVGLGVDRRLFRPMDQQSARISFGIDPAATLLLYVGGMDKYHDLIPLIEALGQITPSSLELHLVGDGEQRTYYEEKARRARLKVKFHGRVPHSIVPQYIAAADLCLAPYTTTAFPNGQVTFSTLKVPEYMSCGRPVISVPSGHILKLIENGVSGLLFPNDVSSWLSFFKTLPSRERLSEMGRTAARAVDSLSWEQTAARYFEICQRLASKGEAGSLEPYRSNRG
jgi:glycosyltransferase involved in cell wall biosynthesis